MLTKGFFQLLALLVMLIPASIYAQKGNISGIIIDKTNDEALIGVNVLLRKQNDTTMQVGGTATDFDGKFKFSNLPKDTYQLRISYVGYETYQVNNLLLQEDMSYPLDTIKLKEASEFFQDIVVEATAIRVEMVGDTLQYNAAAFKVNPDATVEDLIKKMPSISVDADGTVKAQGEQIKKVTIDGKEFFGDDVSTALKNLPAEIVDKIQLYDRSSDQAALTGFSDGDELKALNIITKTGNIQGQFGRFYAGYGTDNRYNVGGNYNYFKGDRKITVLGMTNNINQQNFGAEDLLGVLSSMGGGGGGGRGGRGGGGGGGFSPFAADVMFSGGQSGITKTNALGFNYNDKWGQKVTFAGSYFLTYTQNENINTLARTYITRGDQTLTRLYDQVTNSNNDNLSHRANIRLDYKIDSFNSIMFAPRISWQGNDRFQNFFGENKYNTGDFLNSTRTNTTNDGNGYNLSARANYQHRFQKEGRSLFVEGNIAQDNQISRREQLSTNIALDTADLDSIYYLNQFTKNNSDGLNGNAEITYTEPLGKTGQLQLSFNEAITTSNSDKKTNAYDASTDSYSLLDSTLSSTLQSTYMTHRPTIRYRYQPRGSKISFMVGASYQYATLKGDQSFPNVVSIDKSFNNVLPSAMVRYEFSKSHSFRIFYRTYTSSPTASQLQDIVDNSNPLFLTAGNPDLKQSYAHSLFGRYNYTNPKNAQSVFVNVRFTATDNYIGNSTVIPANDTIIRNDILLSTGAQLSQNVNLSGYMSLNGNVTYSFPLQVIKSNISLTAGSNYNKMPSLINYEKNFTSNVNTNLGVGIGSNISQNLDFYINYNAGINNAKNQLNPNLNTNYFNQTTSAKLNWIFAKRFVFGTNITHYLYTGMADGYNQNFTLWNASIGYKFLKNNQAEINLTVFDILGQNQSIARSVSDVYIQDQSTTVLTRYFMVNFVYNLRNITSGNKDLKTDMPAGHPPMGGGMSPHGPR